VRLGRYARRELRPAELATRRAVRSLRSARDVDRRADDRRELDRQWQWSACYAPLTSMYLDQFGVARACCQNTGHPLGDITTSTLREIWHGAGARELRHALARDDLSKGCEFCAWQRDELEPSERFLANYDELPAGWTARPRWPRQLEFAVSNTCNLQCVMCNGDWSSSIRARREHRPPLPRAYPDRFFDELVEFIPHLTHARFTGGEPFLGTEPQRIMDLLVEHGSEDLVMSVVTNGTVWNDRVERVLDGVRPWITVSVDGGTREVYERIRVGASFEAVVSNLDRFAAVVADHGVGMNLTHCLMVDNWSTFPELLALAEERSLDVAVNVVRFPERHSLYHLPPGELTAVVAAMEDRAAHVEGALTGTRLATWRSQLAALRARADNPTWPAALGIPPDQRSAPDPPVEEVPVAVPAPRRARR
jgi:MoaA/NifB/PqqE/SkfB family radical SAM enzyme